MINQALPQFLMHPLKIAVAMNLKHLEQLLPRMQVSLVFLYQSSPLLNLIILISSDLFSEAASRSSATETVARFLSWDDTASESQSLCNPRPSSLLPDVDDDESECHVLVQNIMSSAGLGTSQSCMVFTGWHLPDHPLDPVLCNKVSELQEKSSYRRLLFDCVNVALIEIGENTLLSAFPWSKRHSRTWRGTSSPDLGVEVWSILKDWIYGARMFVVSKRDNAGIILDRIVKQEVEARGWVKLMMAQVVDITEELEGGVMDELVEEAVLNFYSLFSMMRYRL